MAKILVDTESGVVITEIMPGDRIQRKASIDAFKEKQTQVKVPANERFVKLYNGSVAQLKDCNLTAAEYEVVLFLASNLRYQSNVVQYSNKKLMTRNDLQRDLDLSDKTVKRTVSKLIKEGLLVEVDSTAGRIFIMNPYLFNVGDSISKTVHDLFKKTKWARW